jgi:membrane-associated phospholipid phosphatase
MFPSPPSTFWSLVTRLGEAQIALPVLVASMLWLMLRHGNLRLVTWWLCFLAAAALLTLGTKVAFIGWGVGFAALDFTGVSGHTMFASVVYPLLACLLFTELPPHQRRGAVWAGVALALVVGISRVMVHAHSVSEVVAGLLVGGAASAAALTLARHPVASVPFWVPLGVALWLVITPVTAPEAQTHGMVTRLSLALSGRTEPYTRSDMQRGVRAAAPALVPAPLPAF